MYWYKNKSQAVKASGLSSTEPLGKKWLVVAVFWLSSACAQAVSPVIALAANATAITPAVEQLSVSVLAEIPHDAEGFTQGLLFYSGHFYESTGLYGHSSLRKLDAASGEILVKKPLKEAYFGEGLARVGQQLIQLTWQEGRALVYDLTDFSVQREFHYSGEGWGLCFDGEQLWMSDGSSYLQRRNPEDFSVQGKLEVTLNGAPLDQLNELACVGEHVYANIWHEQRIVRINKITGKVVAEIDASAVVAASGRNLDPQAVLNGIAYDEQADVFYLTGKLWPKIFKVQWQAASGGRKP